LQAHVELLGPLVGDVNQAGLLSAPEIQLAVPLAALAGGAWLARHKSETRLRWYLLAGGALFLTEFPRMDTLHLAWSAPLLLVVGAIVLERVPRTITAAVMLGVVALLVPNMLSRLAVLAAQRAPVAGVEAPAAPAAEIAGVVTEVQQRTRAGEPIFVYPTSPLLYVLADRPNPTRFD